MTQQLLLFLCANLTFRIICTIFQDGSPNIIFIPFSINTTTDRDENKYLFTFSLKNTAFDAAASMCLIH